MWTSQLSAAHVLVRLLFLEEDKTQSSRELGRAVHDRSCFWSAERVKSLGFSTCPVSVWVFALHCAFRSRKHQGVLVYCKNLICSQKY